MRVTTIDRIDPAPGTFVEWAVDFGVAPATSAIPPSFNQGFHLAGAEEQSVWLAAAFDVDGPIDTAALGSAYRTLIQRHPTLCSVFTRHEGTPQRSMYDATNLELDATIGACFDSSAALRNHVRSTMNRRCNKFGDPAYLLAAIDRPDRSTVLCCFDHSHVDALSIAVVIAELHHLYLGFQDEANASDLPTVGSFLDYCADEARTAPVDPTDPRLKRWLSFLRDNHGGPPSFPLPLGLPARTSAPQAVDLRSLLTAAHADRIEQVCKTNGASLFAGLLSAVAHAAHAVSGATTMPVLIPVHTRRTEELAGAVGWFVTNAPVVASVASTFEESLRHNGIALRSAVPLGDVPIAEVVAAAGGLNLVRHDVFMTSYLDYRRVPGADLHRSIDAHHISNVTAADDVQFWFSRTADGVALRTRFPDTEPARSVMAMFQTELSRVLADVLEPVQVSASK